MNFEYKTYAVSLIIEVYGINCLSKKLRERVFLNAGEEEALAKAL